MTSAVLDGRMTVKTLEAIRVQGDYTQVPLRPPGVGIEWQILWAVGKHDDPAGASAGWGFFDPENPAGVWMPTAAQGVDELLVLGNLAAYNPPLATGPFFATWDRYPCYKFYTDAPGSTGTVTCIVIERVGVEGLQ